MGGPNSVFYFGGAGGGGGGRGGVRDVENFWNSNKIRGPN